MIGVRRGGGAFKRTGALEWNRSTDVQLVCGASPSDRRLVCLWRRNDMDLQRESTNTARRHRWWNVCYLLCERLQNVSVWNVSVCLPPAIVPSLRRWRFLLESHLSRWENKSDCSLRAADGRKWVSPLTGNQCYWWLTEVLWFHPVSCFWLCPFHCFASLTCWRSRCLESLPILLFSCHTGVSWLHSCIQCRCSSGGLIINVINYVCDALQSVFTMKTTCVKPRVHHLGLKHNESILLE